MTTPATRSPLELAEAAGLVLFSTVTALPADGSAPEWITLFPKTGRVQTRDGRAFEVSAATLMAAFKGDGLDLPVDVNHATDTAALMGGRADAIGWGTELREHDGALQIKVDWLEEGRALLAARKYRYTSPSFFQNRGSAVRLKAVALVTSPALGGQPALAHAGGSQEPHTMKTIATALGLAEAATEAECLSTLAALKAGSVPKAVHEETLAQLQARTGELDGIRKAAREARVTGLIEGALKAKKIVPAQKDHYVALCATDTGLDTVEKLFAATTSALPGSGLDDRSPPQNGDATADPVLLAAAAQKIQDEAKAAGRSIGFGEAMTLATRKAATA